MQRDRNLLFGIFAVQLGKVTPTQLMEIAGAWAVDPSRDLSQRLVEAGALSERDRGLLDEFVGNAIQAHGGDAAATLETFGGEEQVDLSFRGSIVLTDSGGISRIEDEATLRLEETPDSVPGVQETPGRYTHISEYGRGGMGRVLLVHDQHLARDIALKELLPEATPEASEGAPSPVRLSVPIMARFLQEARITGQLEHPSIVPVYELGYRKDGTLYYTMKLVRGQTLSKALKQAKSLKDRLDLLPHFVDLCQSIAYAHSRGVIHRDIKPGNVMVGEFGETVVIDWGLAKARGQRDIHAEEMEKTFHAMQLGDEAEFANTAYGQAMGTPAYMSPEQAEGQIDKIDERSDVYSLGAVLYEALTGQAPFSGDNVFEVIRNAARGEPKPVSELAPEAPPELTAICERAMQESPSKRYQTARELAEDVQRFLSGRLVQAYEYKAAEYVARFVRQHKAVFATAAAAILLLIAATALYVQRVTTANRNTAAAHKELSQTYHNLEVAHGELLEAREREAAQRERMAHHLYNSSIVLAGKYMGEGVVSEAYDLLLAAPEGLRNWEWGYLYRQGYQRVMLTLAGHSSYLHSASFSPDGTRIVTASTDGMAKVWDAATGEELLTLAGHGDEVSSASFSPDGTRIVTASYDGTAKVWYAGTGEELLTLAGHGDKVSRASFSPDGTRIVTASSDGTAKVWDAATGEELLALAGHSDPVWRASFSPDGTRIVTASRDGTAKVWAATTGEELLTLTGHGRSVFSASFSPDGERIVTASLDGTAKVWAATTGEELLTLDGHATVVLSASFSPDGERIVTASLDKTAKVWDAGTGEELLSLRGHSGWVTSASFSPDGTRIVTASLDKTAKVRDVATGEEPLSVARDPDWVTNWVTSTCFSPDSKRILTTSCCERTAKVWDAATGEELLTLAGHSDFVRWPSFSPDGTRIVTASDDKTAKVWDAATAEELLTLAGHGDEVSSASFSPDGTRIVTASSDQTAKVWDAATAEELLTLAGHGDEVTSASFSPDGTRIVTTSHDQTAKVWEATTGEELLTLDGHLISVTSASFSPDGERIVTASLDGTAKVWAATTGEELLTLDGHATVVLSASFSPDGERIVTASLDKTAKVWDASTGQEFLPLAGHTGGVRSASFSPDGERIVTGSEDGPVRIWETVPWWPEAWHDDRHRGVLIEVARRTSPSLESDTFGFDRGTILAQLHKLKAFFQADADENVSPAVTFVEGQGILFKESLEVDGTPRFSFAEDDVLIRINSVVAPREADVQRILGAILEGLESNAEECSHLELETVNRLDHRLRKLYFPALLEQEVNVPRVLALGSAETAVDILQTDAETDRHFNDFIDNIDNILEHTGWHWQKSDQIVRINGVPIHDMDTLIDVARKQFDAVKEKESHVIELEVNRGPTKCIRLKVHIE